MNDVTPCGNNKKWCESCVSKGKCNYTKNQGIIVELEKTKKKIKNDIILHEEWFVGIDDLEKCLGRIDTVVDKEISELRGE